MLGVAGLQVLFFMAAGMLPRCRFVTKTVLIPLLLSSACTVSGPPLFLVLPCQGLGWGWAGVWEGDTAGRADPDWPRGDFMPDHIRLSSRAGGQSSQGSCCLGTGWALTCWWELLSLCRSLGFLKTFSSFITVFILSHLLFSHFSFSNSIPHPAVGVEIQWSSSPLVHSCCLGSPYAKHNIHYWESLSFSCNQWW